MPTLSTGVPAWSPDIQEFVAGDVIPDALILQCSQVATTTLEGDAPMARVPWVDDDAATFVAEGAAIDEANPTLAETTIATGKLSLLLRVSREQFVQDHSASMLSESAQRAVVTRGNAAFISQPAPTPPAITPPGGIGPTMGIIDAGLVAADLDPLIDLAAGIEENGGTPSHFICAPTTWAALRKLKRDATSNENILGAGTNDSERLLLDVPVLVSSAVPTGKGFLIDRNAIVSAVGPVLVSRSEHTYFSSDSVAVRVTWRIGAAVMRPERMGTFTVPGPLTSA